ncbi:hypothetical protein KAW48_00605 [candidate division WOR-3 bacterium]|nr:hypothetical protein [candidate division WOR-3 bacterium]
MDYIEFKRQFKDFTVISLRDIKKVEENFHRRRLNEWQEKGYIKKVISKYYIFSDLELTENVLFEIANRIYSPSYISLEMALSYYHLIPESVYGISSISTRRTYSFESKIANFYYRTTKPELFFGYALVKYNGSSFKIATIEKCILDYFYLNTDIKQKEDFESLRIDRDRFFEDVKEEKLFEFLNRFSVGALTERIESFLEFMNNA